MSQRPTLTRPRPHARTANRREFLAQGGSAGAALALLGLTGCGSSSSAKAGGGPVKIGMTSDLFPAFSQRGPHGQTAPFTAFGLQHKLSVKVREQNSDTDAYFEHMRTEFLAGAPDINVFAGDVSWPAQFGSQGWLADLSTRFTAAERAAFLPATIDSNTWNGKIYGVPFFTDVGLLYYRKDLLEKAGYSRPPQTWAELQEMAGKVMRDQKIKYGFTFTGANYEGGTLLGTEFIKTSGGGVIDGSTVSVASPAAIEGLKTARSMITSGVSPQAVADYQEGDAEGPFIGGYSVFLRNWAYQFGDIANPKTSKVHPSQVGVTAVPRASTSIAPVNVGGGWNLYIPAESTNQDAAWELIQFMTSAAQQGYTLQTVSDLPTRTALYSDAALIKANPFSALALAKSEVSQTITPPKNAYYKDMSALMAAQFNANLRGAQTPAQSAENLQSGLEQIVKKAGGG